MTWKMHGPAVLLRGSCVDLVPRLAASGFRYHAGVSDPPYGLEFLGHAWDGAVAHQEATWRAIASAGLPGAHLVAMSHDSTYHRLGMAMERAGILPRHMIPWLYATGRCQAQRVAGGDPEHEGLAPRLAPGVEPAYLGRLALEAGCSVAENLRRHGTGALRVGAIGQPRDPHDKSGWSATGSSGGTRGQGYENPYPSGGPRPDAETRYPKNVIHDASGEVEQVFQRIGERTSPSARGGRVDNSLASYGSVIGGKPRKGIVGSRGSGSRYFPSLPRDADSFAYQPKPKGAAREESEGHPTPKPLALKQWLVRMVTCFPGQVVLDPFLGSGTTMRAALDEHMRCVGVELDEVEAGGRVVCPGYCATIVRRCPEVLDHVVARALADIGLRLGVSEEPGLGVVALAEDEETQLGALVVNREPAGEVTCRDPLGRALGLTLESQRVPLTRAWLELDAAPGAPADLGDRLAELASWPEVQALLCRRGDLLET